MMAIEIPPAKPLPARRLLIFTAAAFVVGFVIVFAAIVPAEFGKDPTGLGKIGGLSRLWAPPENVVDANSASGPAAREYPAPYRSDVVEIPLTGFLGRAKGSELEYKVHMQKGAALIYAWEVVGAERADDFHFDFHGHTTPKTREESMTVATYKQGFGLRKQGSLNAPFEGIQGWQFSNSSENPVIVRVHLSGFYDLIPNGQPGNEANIVANVPAAQARPDYPDALKK